MASNMKKTHLIFVYGTLKRGFYFHDQFLGGDKSEAVGPALASLDYSLYIDGMPHLVREKTDKPVKGELYLVDDNVLKSIDELEGPVYKRDVIEVTDENGNKKLAWTYLRPRFFKGSQFAWKEDEFV